MGVEEGTIVVTGSPPYTGIARLLNVEPALLKFILLALR